MYTKGMWDTKGNASMRQIELKALAKINLGLDVLGKREN